MTRVNSPAIELEDEGMVELLLETPIQAFLGIQTPRGTRSRVLGIGFQFGLAAASLRFAAGKLPNTGFSVR
jgi:hypothetical protein